MIKSYCKRCKIESLGDTCMQCGKRAPAGSLRDVWSSTNYPIRDMRLWRGAFLVLLCVLALLLLIVFGLELMMHGNTQTEALWKGRMPLLIFILAPLGLGMMLILLLLQGQETNVYVLDKDGAHQVTWHKPSALRSWARLQTADRKRDVRQQDGTVMRLSQERHMRWEDVVAVKYLPQRSVIRLYHTPHCAPMILRLSSKEEYDLAAAFVGKYCKGK